MTLHVGRVLAVTAVMLCASLPSLAGAQSSSGPLLVIPEAKSHRLVLVDPRSKTIAGTIPVPGWPHEIAFSKDGRTAYVPSYSDAIVGARGFDGQTIDVVDMQSRSVVKTWDLGKPLRPHKAVVTENGDLLITTELSQSLSIVDTSSGKITGQIPTGAAESHVFVTTADGKMIYTANLHAGSVSVMNVPSRKLLKVIPISDLIQRIALTKDERWLFVTEGKSHNVVVIDTKSETVSRRIPVGGIPFSVHLSPDGRWMLVGETSEAGGKLEVIDTKDLTIAHSFDVDRLPFGIEVVGDEAFVACYLSGNVDVLNLSTWTLESPIPNVAHGDGITLWQGSR